MDLYRKNYLDNKSRMNKYGWMIDQKPILVLSRTSWACQYCVPVGRSVHLYIDKATKQMWDISQVREMTEKEIEIQKKLKGASNDPL